MDTFKRFFSFISETKSELKKVSWPDQKEVYSTTIVVILTSVFFGFYLFLVDLALQHGIHYLSTLFRE
ncbi:MAG: preprotein translocase subunit SecE [Acidobacteria bacterium]|nr:preprotein translocase subunit SecE [Acidobacteriota bacterium]